MMDEKERAQYEKMILTPVSTLIPKLAIPTVISMMISMIYNLADAYFVGKLNTSASASIGILLSIQAVFQAIGFMFGHGSGTNISLHLSAGDHDAAKRIASTGFFSAAVVSIIPAVLGLIFITPLMRFCGSTDTILPYAISYGQYILSAGPALALSCVLNNILRYEGKAFYAMIGLVSGGVLNIIGDPILMFGFDMGIDGAGLATAVSQYISMLILLFMFLSGKSISKLSFRSFLQNIPNISELFAILKNGSPSLVRQILSSVATMVLNICAMPFGDAAIAAMAIVGRITMFIGSVMIGIGQGFQPVCSYNYGAKKFARLRESFSFSVKASELVLGCLALLCLFFPAPLVRVFRDDPEVVAIGATALRFQCVGILVQPVSVIANMFFQCIGQSRLGSFTASLRSGLYFIPTILLLSSLAGITGVQLAQSAADVFSAATCVPLLLWYFSKLPKEDQTAEIDSLYREQADHSR